LDCTKPIDVGRVDGHDLGAVAIQNILNAHDCFSFSLALTPFEVLMQEGKENPISIAFGVERNSGMDRGDLANLTAFVAVADQRSFRVAASRVGVTPSALSHSMRQLEERLKVRLLHRTTRSVTLTDAGLRLLDRLRPAISEIAGALEDLNQERQRPLGRLRIYSAHVAAAGVIAPIWGRFLSTYPDVHLELAVGDAPIDIVAKGFDAGMPTDMIAVRVMGPMKIAMVGSPTYFAKRRPPRTPDDLARHSCIQYRLAADGAVLSWPLERNRKSRRISLEGRVMVNNAELAVRAAVDGLGIAYTLAALAEPFLRTGQLVCVLEDWSPAFEGMFLYYPGHRQVPAALRALIDMIRATRGPALARRPLQNPFYQGLSVLSRGARREPAR
jgi:DNA-binding transcriptional LysR family regulator